MLAKTITAKDFNGIERTETFLFHMSEAELAEMDLTQRGGMKEFIQRIIQAQDQPELIKLFKELILKSYGVKSADGREFIKKKEYTDNFTSTNFYSALFMELISDDDSAANFVNGIMPDSIPNVTIEEAQEFIKSGADIETFQKKHENMQGGMNNAPVPIKPIN